MGRPKKAVAPGAVAEDLARFLQELSARSGRTYDAMARVCGVSAATLCRADSGERRPAWEVVRAYVEACGGGAADLRKAERLWRGTPSQVSRSGVRWVEPDAVCEVHQLGELMRAARALSGRPSLRSVEERASALGLVLSRSTLGDAMRPEAVPTETVFCVFMRVIADFAGSPAASYGPEVWEVVWRRVQPGRRPRGRAGTAGGSSRKASAVRGSSAAALVTSAGSSRGGRGGRRPRARAWVRPGPVQEFKDGLYQLYLGAGVPSLDDIAAGVLLDEALAAAPGRDRVNRMLWSAELGLQQDAVAVAGILAAMAGLDPAAAAENVRELWVKAAAVRLYGCAVGEADPLALGVRETFVLPSGGRTLPALVPYVRRQHDQAIEAVVGRAVAGRSGMVIARGPQAAGKTRSCWEALRGLPAGWRLWHPTNPFDGTQIVQGLANAGPRTVVWLDRVERYLDPVQYRDAGTVQAELRNALHDARRAPVLVIGTVSAAAGVLTRSGGLTPAADTVVRTLIEDAVVDVSPKFTKAELMRLADLADLDDRLAIARDHARSAVPKFLATSRKAHPILAPKSFHTAVEQGDTDTLFMGGTLLRQSGRLEEAATWYQRAAEAGDSQAIEPAAALLTENGEPQGAISWLQSLAEAGDPDAAVAAARRLLATGRDAEAIRTYQHAALAGDSNRALRAAAALMRRSGRTQEAVRWLRTCAERGNPVALQEAAHLLWEMGDRTRALKFYTDAGSAGELAAWRDAAERLQSLGRGDEAVIMYRAAVRHGDRQSGLPLADLLVEQGRLQEALEIYLQEAEKQKDPEEQSPDLAVLRRVANLYRFTEQPDKALAWLYEAADRGDVAAFMQIGLILRDKCDQGESCVDEAVEAFTRAAAAGEWHAYRESVWLLRKYRGLKAAVEWLHRRIEGKDRRAVREMADLLREAGMVEEALTWYLRAAEQGSEYATKYALRLQAQLLSGKDAEVPPEGSGSAATGATEATEVL
ncbi:helix-turn-helix domain-containing protein [Kitasatospora purpeofusca]|uniref:helix-turn-helix domain-containing protein n=1 Tax=Kitasatospora purpeofusca TaxID=67352 RepID=UPI0036CFCAC7